MIVVEGCERNLWLQRESCSHHKGRTQPEHCPHYDTGINWVPLKMDAQSDPSEEWPVPLSFQNFKSSARFRFDASLYFPRLHRISNDSRFPDQHESLKVDSLKSQLCTTWILFGMDGHGWAWCVLKHLQIILVFNHCVFIPPAVLDSSSSRMLSGRSSLHTGHQGIQSLCGPLQRIAASQWCLSCRLKQLKNTA